MTRIVLFFLFIPMIAWGQYDDYESYQTFTDLDRDQRDYGLVFSPSFMYLSVGESNDVTGNTVTNRKRDVFLYDLKFGYIFRKGFYFGILYSGESQDINQSSPKTSRESVGMSFGYIHRGWSFLGTFFPYSKQDLENTLDIRKYSEGMGFQLEAGYFFRLNRHFSLGPHFVYKNIQYGEGLDAITDVSRDASSNHTIFTPMVSLLINLYRG